MARKSTKKTAQPKPAKAGADTLQLKIGIDPDEATPFFYVNHAEVACTVNEFSIYAARLPTKLSAARLKEAQETGQAIFPSEVQLIFPIPVLDGLITAFERQREYHRDTFGAGVKANKKDGK